MSSIAITGGATGTGVFSLLAPSTNTNRTLTLPDSAGTVATNEAIAAAGYTTSAGVLTQFNASGSAPVYACRAWVNFNGSGTIAIRASGNVSSLTDVGAGDYRVNFIDAMQDANYSAVITSGQKGVVWGIVLFSTSNPFLTTSVGLVTQTPSDSPNDNPYVCVSIFR